MPREGEDRSALPSAEVEPRACAMTDDDYAAALALASEHAQHELPPGEVGDLADINLLARALVQSVPVLTSGDQRQGGTVVVRRAHKGPRPVYRVELYLSDAMVDMTNRDLGLVLADDVKRAVALLRAQRKPLP